jgi:hypothetical protein
MTNDGKYKYADSSPWSNGKTGFGVDTKQTSFEYHLVLFNNNTVEMSPSSCFIQENNGNFHRVPFCWSFQFQSVVFHLVTVHLIIN